MINYINIWEYLYNYKIVYLFLNIIYGYET